MPDLSDYPVRRRNDTSKRKLVLLSVLVFLFFAAVVYFDLPFKNYN